MKKNQYRKPYMAFEQFAPNQYVAGCWFAAPGDCYSDLYEDSNVAANGGWHRYNSGEHIVNLTHEYVSPRIPENGYFKEEETPVPTQIQPPPSTDLEYFVGIGYPEIGSSYTNHSYFTQVYPYIFEHNGVRHYIKLISYSSNRNQS